MSLFALAALASALVIKPKPIVMRVKIVRVIDADTIEINRIAVGKRMKIRVNTIDTPESQKSEAKCELELNRGIAAKEFATDFAVKTGMRAVVTIISPDARLGRWVGDVSIRKSGKKLSWADVMLDNGHAKPYNPVRDKYYTKPNWCE